MRSIVLVVCAAALALGSRTDDTATILLRGHEQTLHVSGPSQGNPVVVSTGDGGWVHLGPHVAEVLASRGFRVFGFDARQYLASFTSGQRTLRAEDEPADYRVLAAFASRAAGRKPILVGVSEGAGLSVLAATDPQTKAVIAGVVGLGLPNLNELGWRWRDSLIYLTHKVPNEPTFSAAAIVSSVGPVPLALIHSTHDEFVSVADVQAIYERATQPKRLWIVAAGDHRFSDNLAQFDQRLLEAIAWVAANTPR
jgi:alpha-beta hydrolase superfamily lysophospholipase